MSQAITIPLADPAEDDRQAKQHRMQRVINHYQSIGVELREACMRECAAERALWREQSAAKREHRRPRKHIIDKFMAAQAAREQLKLERELHRPQADADGFATSRQRWRSSSEPRGKPNSIFGKLPKYEVKNSQGLELSNRIEQLCKQADDLSQGGSRPSSVLRGV